LGTEELILWLPSRLPLAKEEKEEEVSEKKERKKDYLF